MENKSHIEQVAALRAKHAAIVNDAQRRQRAEDADASECWGGWYFGLDSDSVRLCKQACDTELRELMTKHAKEVLNAARDATQPGDQ